MAWPCRCAKVLMKYSNYSNVVTDKAFFETFYDALSATMQLALEVPNSLSYKKEVEMDLGHIFRTQYFNTSAREEERNKLVDTLTVSHETPWEGKGSSDNMHMSRAAMHWFMPPVSLLYFTVSTTIHRAPTDRFIAFAALHPLE